MLGLEEKMSADVVDMRPDRFLRAMRDSGDWNGACAAAGLTSEEACELCKNPKFDLATVECQLEYHEEQIIEATEAAIEQARADRAARIQTLREQAYADFKARHPEQKEAS